jgi:hypothetical protein
MPTNLNHAQVGAVADFLAKLTELSDTTGVYIDIPSGAYLIVDGETRYDLGLGVQLVKPSDPDDPGATEYVAIANPTV